MKTWGGLFGSICMLEVMQSYIDLLFVIYCFREKIVNSITDFVFTIIQQMSNFFGEWMDGYNAFLEKFGDYCDTIMLHIKSKLQGSSNETAIMMRDLLNRAGKLAKEFMAYVKANQGKWMQAFTSLNESVRGRLLNKKYLHLCAGTLA